MHARPYVGITGVTCRSQSEALSAMAEELGWPRSRKLMVGALVSYKGLAWGRLANPNLYVPVDGIDRTLIGDGRFLNLVHYNSRAAGLFAQLKDVVKRVTYADGIQLNVAWPQPAQLRRLRERIYTTVVLQIGRGAYKMAGNSPRALVRALRPYDGLIEYALIDPSGGQGKPFDSEFAMSSLAAVMESGLAIKWGIAGGLGPGNLDKLSPLLEIYPELSWDAQSGLRDEADHLDLAKCRDYLSQSAELVQKSLY